MPLLLTKPWKTSASTTVPLHLLEGQESAVQEAKRMLDEAEYVLIGTHQHPDGDALGSSLAFAHALEAAGKHVTVFIPDEAPEFFQFLPGFAKLTTVKPNAKQYDVILLLDYTQLYRTHLEEEALAHAHTICIDHHHDNLRQADINIIVPHAAATAQILFEYFYRTNTPITKDIATCLLTGIFTDTGSFMHDATTPEILQIASHLMAKGARLSHIAHETFQKRDLPSLRIWGKALSRIMTNQQTGASVSVITYTDMQECGATLDDLSGVVNMINTLPNTKYAMLLVEFEPNMIKGSLRSEPHKNVDVSKIARRLGGGGHKLASGFEVPGRIVHQGGRWRIVPA